MCAGEVQWGCAPGDLGGHLGAFEGAEHGVGEVARGGVVESGGGELVADDAVPVREGTLGGVADLRQAARGTLGILLDASQAQTREGRTEDSPPELNAARGGTTTHRSDAYLKQPGSVSEAL